MTKEVIKIEAELDGTKQDKKEQVISIVFGLMQDFDIKSEELNL